MNLIKALDARIATDARALAPIFPQQCDRQPALHLLRCLAFDSAPATDETVLASYIDTEQMQTALSQMPNIARDGETITGFAGLSRTKTKHQLTLVPTTAPMSTTVRYGWCAWDTMFLPALLGCTATVETSCPITNEAIIMHIEAGTAFSSSHESAILTLPLNGEFDAASARATFCCSARLLANPAAAQQWNAEHPTSACYSLEAGMRLGVLATAALHTDQLDTKVDLGRRRSACFSAKVL